MYASHNFTLYPSNRLKVTGKPYYIVYLSKQSDGIHQNFNFQPNIFKSFYVLILNIDKIKSLMYRFSPSKILHHWYTLYKRIVLFLLGVSYCRTERSSTPVNSKKPPVEMKLSPCTEFHFYNSVLWLSLGLLIHFTKAETNRILTTMKLHQSWFGCSQSSPECGCSIQMD